MRHKRPPRARTPRDQDKSTCSKNDGLKDRCYRGEDVLKPDVC